MNVELGDEVKCKITGYRGIATAIAKCLTGCDRIEIRPPMTKEGKMSESFWFDEAAVEVVKKQAIKPASVQDERPNKKGGPILSSWGLK